MILPFVIHIPAIFCLAYLFRKYHFCEPLSFFFWPGLLLKLGAGVALGLIYAYYYGHGGDTWDLFGYAVKLNNFLIENPKDYFNALLFNDFNLEMRKEIFRWDQPRAMFFIKIISIANWITFNNYWITSLYFSFFSFIGLWILGNTLIKIYNVSRLSVIISFLIFPSFILWSSGILKESITIGAIAFIISIALNLIESRKKIYFLKLIFLLILIYIAWELKFFYIIILVPALLSYLLITLISRKFPQFSTFIIFFLLLFFFSSLLILFIIIHPALNLEYLIFILFESYTVILNVTHFEGSHNYQFDDLRPDLLSLIINTPKALFIGLFRPLPWETKLDISLIVGLENFLILLLSFQMLFRKIFTDNKPLHPLIISAVIYILITAALMAFIAPNWGTLTRYKVGYLHFLLLIITNNNPLINYIKGKFLFVERINSASIK